MKIRTTPLLLLFIIISIGVSSQTSNEKQQKENNKNHEKHIVFVHQLSSWSHCVPMMVYSEELLSRGYKISLASFNQMLDIAKQAQETTPSLNAINLISTGDINLKDMGKFFGHLIHEEQTSQVLFSAFTAGFNSTYPPQFETLSNYVKTKKVDLFSCDVFALACMDVATLNNIPFVITFPTSIDHFALSSHPYYPHYLADQNRRSDDPFLDRFYTQFIAPIFETYYGGIWKRFLIDLRERHGVKGLEIPYLRSFFFPDPIVSEWSDKHILVEDYFFLAHTREVSPLFHIVGPSGHFGPNENVDPSFISKLDSAKDRGVILISTGSQAMMTPGQIKEIEAAFSTPLPGRSDLPLLIFSSRGSPKEIFPQDSDYSITLSWVPQKEVLAHPATVLFVSHGGLGSVYEAIFNSVPLLLLPLFGDQPRNSGVLREKFLAEVIHSKLHFNAQEIRSKSLNLLSDPRFADSLAKTSQIFKIRNKNAPIRAADIYEEVLINYDHLLPLYHNVPFWKVYQFDLYFAVLFVVLFHFWIFKHFVFNKK